MGTHELLVLILIVLWQLGVVSGTTIGGAVHGLLAIVLVLVAWRLVQGRRVR